MMGPVGPRDFDLDELKMAFELRVVHMVMTADETVHPAELEFIETVFPPEQLDAHGFLDRSENRFTRRFGKAIQAAPDALAQWLSPEDKVEMLRLFFKASEADGEVDPRELSVIVQAGRMLGVPQDDLVPHLSRLLGSRSLARPGTPSRPALATGGSLATTQDGIHAALSGATPTGQGGSLRERVDAALRDDGATLTLIVTIADVREGRMHGFESLIGFAARHGTLLVLAGRIGIAFDAWETEPRPPSDVPEIRDYLGRLVSTYPWLPAWLLPHDGMSGQLVASCVPVDVDHPDYVTYFLAFAVEAANWAVALIRSLGGTELDAVYEYLADLGMVDIPPGFFDGVEPFASQLDPGARAAGPE